MPGYIDKSICISLMFDISIYIRLGNGADEGYHRWKHAKVMGNEKNAKDFFTCQFVYCTLHTLFCMLRSALASISTCKMSV